MQLFYSASIQRTSDTSIDNKYKEKIQKPLMNHVHKKGEITVLFKRLWMCSKPVSFRNLVPYCIYLGIKLVFWHPPLEGPDQQMLVCTSGKYENKSCRLPGFQKYQIQ